MLKNIQMFVFYYDYEWSYILKKKKKQWPYTNAIL